MLPANNTLEVEGPRGVEALKFAPVLQTNNESLLRLAALEGMGLAFLPRVLIARDLEAGALEAVLPDYRFFGTKLYGVYRHRKYLSPKVRTFLDFVCDDARVR
jgi:DNA-binding transcriptional LysR family regulator